MLNNIKSISVLALLACATPLAAQETATDEAATADEATTPPGGELNMGTPVASGELQEGQPYESDVHGDWTLRCVYTADSEDVCQPYQLLADQDGNSVAEITIFPLPEGQRAAAGATLVAPLETFLPAQLTMAVDGGEARQYPFTFCTARTFSPLLSSGCVARIGMPDDQVAQFKRGNTVQIVLRPAAAPDELIELTLSLTGFTAALEAVRPGQ